MKSKLTTSLLSLLLMGGAQAASAQGQLVLNESDFNVPSWTQLCRTLSKMNSASAPYSICMTLNGDVTTQMAFAWFTNTSCADGVIQIVEKADAKEADFAGATTVEANHTLVKDLNYSISKNQLTGITPNEKKSYYSHKVTVKSLTPGTSYSYRVGTEGNWSEIGHFTTAQQSFDSGYSFIYITDTQAQNDEMFDVSQNTVHTAMSMFPDSRFVLCNGDLVETSGAANSEWEYEQWFATMQDVWSNYPLLVTQGNHDTSNNHNFFYHFNNDTTFNATSPVRTDMNGTVFSVVYGDALFLVINYEDWRTPGYFDALAQWMRKEVETNKDVKWRVATFHKNMFTGSRSHQDDADGKAVREAMLPVFDELKINMALQGHDHIYEVIGPVDNLSKSLEVGEVTEVETITPAGVRENMTGKAGGVFNVNKGTLYFLNNSAGKKKYEPRTEEQMVAAYGAHGIENYWKLFSGKFGQTGEPTFSKVNVSKDAIEIETYVVDNAGKATLFDAFKVIKDDELANGLQKTEQDNNAKITSDGSNIVIEGVKAEGVNIYTEGGEMVMQSFGNTVNASALKKGVYIVSAKVGKKTYISKVNL